MNLKLKTARLAALLLLVAAGWLATYGFLLAKNAVFNWIASFGGGEKPDAFLYVRFAGGLALFGLGVGFIAGWVVYRDRKRRYRPTSFRRPPKRR